MITSCAVEAKLDTAVVVGALGDNALGVAVGVLACSLESGVVDQCWSVVLSKDVKKLKLLCCLKDVKDYLF